MALWETRVQIPSVRTRVANPMTSLPAADSMPALARLEHSKGAQAVEDELFKARSALLAGQDDGYKAHLQSAFLSIQLLLQQAVGQ